jgi:cysteine-rich repeat protein
VQTRRSLPVASIVAIVTALGGARSAQAATDTYRFRDKLQSDEGAPGNVLVPTFNNGDFQSGTFVDTVIDANACSNTPTVRGYSFPAFGGLRSPNNAPVLVGESYTISLIVKFSPLRSGYTRLIDFSNSTLDDGIYVLNNGISFYPVGTYAPGSFADDRFSVLTLTRDAATNVVSLFIGLTAAGTYEDTGKRYVPSAGNMHFFMDNTTGAAAVSESSAGIVTFLRVSDRPIAAASLAQTIADACQAVACGNAKLEPGEGCDDGNNVDGDGCSSTCKIENGLACGTQVDAGADAGDAGGDFTPGSTCQSGVCDPADSKCGYQNGAGSTCDPGDPGGAPDAGAASDAGDAGDGGDAADAGDAGTPGSVAPTCRSKVCGVASRKCIPPGGCFVDGDCPPSLPACNAATFTCGERTAPEAGSPAGPADSGARLPAPDAGAPLLPVLPPEDDACSCGVGPRGASLPAVGVSLIASIAAIARGRLRRRRRG